MTAVAAGAPPRTRRRRLAIAFAAVVAWALYAPTVEHALVWDDHVAIEGNRAVTSGDVRLILTSPFWGPGHADVVATWRPLITAQWAIERAVSDSVGVNPTVVHRVGNLAAWVTLVVALAVVLDVFAFGAAATFLALAFFFVHPALVEPVCWTVGRADLCAATAVLLALAALHRRRDAWVVAALAIGLLCKESAIVGLVPLAVMAWMQWKKGARSRDAALVLAAAAALVLVAFVAARVMVLGAALGPPPSLVENPLVVVHGVARWVEGLRVVGLAMGLVAGIVAPRPDWGLGAFPVASGPAWPAIAAVGLLALIAVASWAARRQRTPAAAAAALALGPLLLFGQPWIDLPTATADRLWPLLVAAASLGLALLAQQVSDALVVGAPRAGRAGAAAAFGVCSAAMVLIVVWFTTVPQRLAAWRDDDALFTEALRASPASYRALVNRAGVDVRAGDPHAAIARLQRAVALAPEAPFGHLALGRAAVAAGDAALAARAIAGLDVAAGHDGPDAAELRCAVAVRFGAADAVDRCRRAVRAGTSPRPLTWMWLAMALDGSGQSDPALRAFDQALVAATPAPADPLIVRNRGVFLARRGDFPGALAALVVAVDAGDHAARGPLEAVMARLDASGDAAQRARIQRLRARLAASNSGHDDGAP